MVEREQEEHAPISMSLMLNNTVFGFTDGLITDMAVVAGMVAASRSSLYFVVVAALAATLAGAISMFLGAYVAAHTRYRFAQREKALEDKHVESIPDSERQEVRDIYLKHGFTPEETELLVKRVTSDRELWVKTMLREEMGFGEEDLKSPSVGREAIIGLSFLVGSFIPIIPFLVVTAFSGIPAIMGLTELQSAFVVSLVLSVISLVVMGAYKERFGEGRPAKGALQMLAVGLGGAATVYLIITGITALMSH
jgi:VIT1/CCC1 family predicted Fe2+/Mn2+ transporter